MCNSHVFLVCDFQCDGFKTRNYSETMKINDKKQLTSFKDI